MPIKNYTTKIQPVQTVSEIQGMLATHGAKKIMFDYGDNGSVSCITFALEQNGSLRGYKLESKPHGVIAAMARDGMKCDSVQAEKIAWRNVKDWIAAQIALIETEQATMEELFFPKMIYSDNSTVFESYQLSQFQIGASDRNNDRCLNAPDEEDVYYECEQTADMQYRQE